MIELHVTAESVDKRVSLREKVTVFGRTAQAADVPLDWDRMVSSRHFQIAFEEDCYVLTDLGSTNGTKVNGNDARRWSLRVGDAIQVGTTQLTVVDASGQAHEDRALDEELRDESAFMSNASASTARRTASKFAESPTELAPVQQVRLRVTSESDNGKVFWFGAGNSLIVGRTALADCVFAGDHYMSGEHCRVICTSSGCQVEDLQSRGGTWVNGESVKSAALFDGDSLRAGNTTFAVELITENGERLGPPSNREVVSSSLAGKLPRTALEQIQATRKRLTGELEALVGELTDALTPGKLVELLAQLGRIALIVDFSRIGLSIPNTIQPIKATLFPWLPGEAAVGLPMLVDLDEWKAWPDGVEEAWGSDAVVILCGAPEKEELLGHLRDLMHKSGPVQGIVGLCWPNVLRPLLASEGEGLPARLFSKLAITAFEISNGSGWQMVGKPKSLEKLKELGVQIIDEVAITGGDGGTPADGEIGN